MRRYNAGTIASLVYIVVCLLICALLTLLAQLPWGW